MTPEGGSKPSELEIAASTPVTTAIIGAQRATLANLRSKVSPSMDGLSRDLTGAIDRMVEVESLPAFEDFAPDMVPTPHQIKFHLTAFTGPAQVDAETHVLAKNC